MAETAAVYDRPCPTCAFGNRREARFCGDCGQPMSARGGRGLMTLAAITIAAALGGAVVAHMVLSRRGETGPAPAGVNVASVPQAGAGEEARSEPASPQKKAGMARIPAGEFWMGAPEGEGNPEERPRHGVYLDEYEMDLHEVTAAEYRKFCSDAGRPMREQPSWNADDHPVVNVSWNDAKAYCDWAGKRLPTEAEWEKAARGGAATKYCFGDDEGRLGDYAWFSGNSGRHTHPVGQKRPNQYGLYDMHGNAQEWVADWFDYYSNSPRRNPKGPAAGEHRIHRGGSWLRPAVSAWSARRFDIEPELYGIDRGFRCARSPAAVGKGPTSP